MKRTADNYGGISSAADKKATGKTWREWLAILDKAGAAKLPHKDIVQRLQRSHRLADRQTATNVSCTTSSTSSGDEHRRPRRTSSHGVCRR